MSSYNQNKHTISFDHRRMVRNLFASPQSTTPEPYNDLIILHLRGQNEHQHCSPKWWEETRTNHHIMALTKLCTLCGQTSSPINCILIYSDQIYFFWFYFLIFSIWWSKQCRIFIHSSIHSLSVTAYPLQGCVVAGANPRWQWARAGYTLEKSNHLTWKEGT